MIGNFFEILDGTGSYRVEYVGLCAINHLISALCLFYNVKNPRTLVNYDNQGAVDMSERKLSRTRLGSSCADIFWNIWNTRNKMGATAKYQQVNGHVDKYLLWDQLSLEYNMTVFFDGHAENAVVRANRTGMRREGNQLLPGEDAAVFVNNKKLT